MFTLAHLSDPHLGPLPPARFRELLNKRLFGYLNWYRRQGIHRPDVLEALVADMRTHAPDHIAVTGDLVNIALPEEFTRARAWLGTLGDSAHVSAIPGNHDAYVATRRSEGVRLWADYMTSNEAGADFAGADDTDFPYVRVLGDTIALIGTSTGRATAPFMAAGRLGRGQLARVAEALSALGSTGLIRVLLIHHPPLPGMANWRRGLHDAGALHDVLKRHGAELVLHGHEHRFTLNWLSWSGGTVPVVGAPSASAAASATRPDPSHKPPGAYHLYRFAPGANGCVIKMTRRGLLPVSARVGTLGETCLSPPPGRTNTPEFVREND